MATFDACVENQRDLHGHIARTVENLRKLGAEKKTQYAIETRIKTLEKNWAKFEHNHDKLASARTESSKKHDYFADDLYAVCEEAYIDQMAILLKELEEITRKKQLGNQEASLSSELTHALPKINLPRFSGAYHEWIPFRDMFKALISRNKNLTNVERHHYLSTHVSGEAAQLISNIAVTEDHFESAWATLVDRYENKRILVTAYLDVIFNQKAMTRESATELKTIYANIKQAIGALKSLQAPVEQWDWIINYQILRLFDLETHRAWTQHIGRATTPASFPELAEFINCQITSLEEREARAGGSKPRSNDLAKLGNKRTAIKSHAAMSSNLKCALCSDNHYVSACADYRGKTEEERREFIEKNQLCYNCLGYHRVSACRSAKRCYTCGKPHHTTIHGASSPRKGAPSTVATASVLGEPNASDESQPAPILHASPDDNNIAAPRRSQLATAIVNIIGQNRVPYVARVLLDSGSELSFVRESVVQSLRLPRQRAAIPLIGIGGRRSPTTKGVVELTVQSRIDPNFVCNVIALILPQLTGTIPVAPLPECDWEHLHGLALADPDYAKPGRIDIIIGADYYGDVLRYGLRLGPPQSPIAQETAFGWTISGPVVSLPTQRQYNALTLSCEEDDLNTLLERFWELEDVPRITTPKLTKDEQLCEQQFVTTHTRNEQGKYTVRLPFKSRPTRLGNSRAAAERALIQVHRRARSDTTFKELYFAFLEEYQALGHMSPVSDPLREPAVAYYLPHHGVMRDSSTTTRLRVVFNGSKKTDLGVSLNQYLLPGPKLQNDLIDVLLRWRWYPIVFCADLEKMYRQILLHPSDWDYQRIVWSAAADDPPTPYHLKTVTYGLTSAPYLALRVLRQLATDDGDRYPLAVETLRSEIYVDDILSGAYTQDEAMQKIAQLDRILMAGGFRARKWASAIPEILDGIEAERKETLNARTLEDTAIHKALGLSWRRTDDRFVFSVDLDEPPTHWTKRKLLSVIARLFDPLGWIAPIVIVAKMIFQDLWKEALGWDDQIPDHALLRWTKFYDELPSVRELSLPRWIGTNCPSPVIEIHGFSDASLHALAACVYIRVLHDDPEEATVTLVASKTRVSPLKRVTVPRLELSAALLLTRLVSRVCATWNLEMTPLHLWTDSAVTLVWVRGHSSRWKDFVGNRVALIQDMLPRGHWHHVPGEQNPADIASRGTSPKSLQSCPSWWQGPPWLRQPSTFWPSSSTPDIRPTDDLEARAHVVNTVTAEQRNSVWKVIDRFSHLHRLLRVTAWIFRAISVLRGNRKPVDLILTTEELASAQNWWVKHTQSLSFGADLIQLQRYGEVTRSSKLKALTPFLDNNGILRVGGRLKNALLDREITHPIILPPEASLTRLIVDEGHRRTLHGGVQHTLATIRRQYWILRGRSVVKSHILRCVRCARQRARTAQQLMGQLPRTRVTPSRPFQNIGVDYAGPFVVKTWRGRAAKTYKAFLVVFVCFSTSAVHLELATDYSTAGFLAAYRRFVGRRGASATITSDHGTNFIGADAELKSMFAAASRDLSTVRDKLSILGTQWHFQPPGAPHFGGKWEAAVKSVKHHLRRVLGTVMLTYEEFSTPLAEIEGVLNSRPLCPLSDDPEDIDALTPGHFLVGGPLTAFPEPSLLEETPSRLTRWQLVRQFTERFWQRWSSECLQRMRGISKWQFKTDSLKIGTLVIVADERYPPTKWPLARITELHPGTDGLVRVATIRTATTTLRRPITKLCVLPVDCVVTEKLP